MKTIGYKILTCLFLFVSLAHAQDKTQKKSTTSMGAKWSSGGSYTSFGIAGQYAISNSVAGGNYTGSFGFLGRKVLPPEENIPPIAIAPDVNFAYELGSIIVLEGIDPEAQPITFEIVRQPSHGTVDAIDPNVTNEIVFIPDEGLAPDVIYNDSLVFRVAEVNSSLVSNEAKVYFNYIIEDQVHIITDLNIDGTNFNLTFEDHLINAAYTIDVNYYDISDLNNPTFVNIQSGSFAKEEFVIEGTTVAYDFAVDDTQHAYLFTQTQVLLTVLVATENGFSSFASYVVENTGGSRVLASEDGQFFVIGSEMTVPENKSVKLKMLAIDFSNIDISTGTFEWLNNPTMGTIGDVTLVEQSNALAVWEVEYTSTEDVGGTDMLNFQVFNPVRNSFESGTVTVEIADVNDLPVLKPIANQLMNEDGSLDVTIEAEDPDNELSITAQTSEASNVTATVTNGVLTLTALNDFSGLVKVSVLAEEIDTEEQYLRLQNFDVDIAPINDPPVLANINAQTALEDSPIIVALSAQDPDLDFQVFHYNAVMDDPFLGNIEIDGSILKVIPFDDVFGTANVTVTADDGSGTATALSDPVTFGVEFTAVNDSPELLQQLGTQNLVQDFPGYDIDLSAYFADAETDAKDLTYTISGNTAVLINVVQNIATVTLQSGFSGNEDITFSAADASGLSASMTVAFIVNAASVDLTTTGVADIQLDEDFGTHQVDISSTFSRTGDPTAEFTYELIGNNYINASVENGLITFTSTQDLVVSEDLVLIGSTAGISTFTQFAVTINPVNDAPSIVGLSDLTVNEDGQLQGVAVRVEDVDSDGVDLDLGLTVVDETIVANSGISITGNDGFYTFSITPLTNTNGTVTIEANATDGLLQTIQTFELTVNAVNDLPTVVSSIDNADEDVLESVDINTLFGDVDGDVLTYEVNASPAWVNRSGDILSGTPLNEDVGLNLITITAMDAGSEIRETFEFQVINTNDAPILEFAAGEKTTFTGDEFTYAFPEANFYDEDGNDVLTYAFENVPSWASVTSNVLAGTPASAGTHSITLRATDLAGASTTDVLTLFVEDKVYDADITLTGNEFCSGITAEVIASGAFDYNWYDQNDNLLQEGGSSYEFVADANLSLFVEGVDAQGITTAAKTEISINVLQSPDATITQGETFSVPDQSGVTYQWYFEGSPIDGSMGTSITPTETGEYYVTVTSTNGCVAMSEIVMFVVTSVDDIVSHIQLYPIPAKNWLNLKSDKSLSGYNFQIVDISGAILQTRPQMNNEQVKFDLSSLEQGIYVLQMLKDGQVQNLKFIKI